MFIITVMGTMAVVAVMFVIGVVSWIIRGSRDVNGEPEIDAGKRK